MIIDDDHNCTTAREKELSAQAVGGVAAFLRRPRHNNTHVPHQLAEPAGGSSPKETSDCKSVGPGPGAWGGGPGATRWPMGAGEGPARGP